MGILGTSFGGADVTTTSVTGGTWTRDAGSHAYESSSTVGVDVLYCFSLSGGTTTITVTYTGAAASFITFWEYSYVGTPAFDTSASFVSAGASNPWNTLPLTLSGSNDLLFTLLASPWNGATSINAPWSRLLTASGFLGAAVDENTNSGSSALVFFSGSTPIAISTIGFK